MSLVKTFLVRKVSIFSKNLSSARHARLCAGHFYTKRTPKENFPIKQKRSAVLPDMEYSFGYTKHNTATPKSAAISNPMQKNAKKP